MGDNIKIETGTVIEKIYPSSDIKRVALGASRECFIKLRMRDGREVDSRIEKDHFHLLRIGDDAELRTTETIEFAVPGYSVINRNPSYKDFRESIEFDKWRKRAIRGSVSDIAFYFIAWCMLLAFSVAFFLQDKVTGIFAIIVANTISGLFMKKSIKRLRNIRVQDIVFAGSGVIEDLYEENIGLSSGSRAKPRIKYMAIVSTENETFNIETSYSEYGGLRVGRMVKFGIIRGEDPFIL